MTVGSNDLMLNEVLSDSCFLDRLYEKAKDQWTHITFVSKLWSERRRKPNRPVSEITSPLMVCTLT